MTEFQPEYEFNELENSFEFDLSSFEDFEVSFVDEESRYIKPPKSKNIKEQYLVFENAQKLAKDINLQGNDNIFVIISGNFIFGDFIEALFYSKNIYTKRLQISTLSLSLSNIISLRNLMRYGYVDSLDLIVSDYFFAHERSKLVKDIYKYLDHDNRFQLAVAGIHTKIVSFETELGKKYVIHGSANLRSSNSVEQIHITDNTEMYDFVTDYNNKIIQNTSTINKNLRGKKLWQQIQETKEPVDHSAQSSQH